MVMSTEQLSQADAAASSCIRKYRHLSRINYFSARRVERKRDVMARVLFSAEVDAKGEPVNETFVIEDIKLKPIGSPTEVLSRRPAPKATMPHLRKLIRRRMSFRYGQKEVQAVRLVNVNNEEVYHWTWFQEQIRREKIGRRQSGRRTVEAMSV
jgi:hypothetical protein